MNKKNKILLTLLILGLLTFVLSVAFYHSINKGFRPGISVLLIIETIFILKYTLSTYDRDSLDFWTGVRIEIFSFCLLLVFWAFIINFV